MKVYKNNLNHSFQKPENELERKHNKDSHIGKREKKTYLNSKWCRGLQKEQFTQYVKTF